MTVFEEDGFGRAEDFGEDMTETGFARERRADRIYLSKTFHIDRENSSDFGQPARIIHKVFDNGTVTELRLDGEEWVVYESEAGRVQLKLLVVREQGRVKELWVQKVPPPGVVGKTKIILNLREPNVTKLIDLIRGLEYIKLEGGATVRVDDSLIRQVFDDPLALDQAYAKDRERFKMLIQNDVAAKDVIALAHRREQVALFRRYIEDQEYFESVRENTPGKSAERVWQLLFEANPWILGLGLGTRLLTSWDDDRLEQIVAGSNVAGVGKRVDAFMQTAGRVRSIGIR